MFDKIEEFVLGWDTGRYDVESNWDTLETLEERFRKSSLLYRGTRSMVKIKPPLSWTISIDALERYFTIVGIPGYSIPAYVTTSPVTGLDVSAVATWLCDNENTKGRLKVAARRLAMFDEVVTLDVPRVKKIGTLVEDRRSHVVKLVQQI